MSQRHPDILEIFSLYSHDRFRSPIVIELVLVLVLGFFSVPREKIDERVYNKLTLMGHQPGLLRLPWRAWPGRH
jgi:hypothetical protein